MNASADRFKSGDFANTTRTIDEAFTNKNALYYLELANVQRLSGPRTIPQSNRNFLIVDRLVQNWEVNTATTLNTSLSTLGSYLISEGLSSDYNLKPYEMTILSQSIALNHLSQGNWNDAMVEAKKMAQREKIIEASLDRKVAAIVEKQKEQVRNPNTQGSTYRIEAINGYPVNLLNDPEANQLKNAYQNPSAYYLSGFIHEAQGETSLAAPSYRLAIELKPSVNFFRSSLANLDKNVVNRNQRKDAETLFIIDTGFIPKVESFKFNQTFIISGYPKIITLTFPVIEPRTEMFAPTGLQVNGVNANPEMVTNISAMARRNLKDEMPAYVLRTTTRAILSLATQLAAQRAAEKNKNNNNALAIALAGLVTGFTLDAINIADVRHWSTLPAQTYMMRMTLPSGKNTLQFSLPNGAISTQEVNLANGYNVVYLRLFRDRATVLTSNDPNARNPVEKLPALVTGRLPAEEPVKPTADKKTGNWLDGVMTYLNMQNNAKAEPPISGNEENQGGDKASSAPKKVDNEGNIINPSSDSTLPPNVWDSLKQLMDK
ncbi:MAG: hypothetical protein JHC80_03785 [Polynucleobacter sp.]|nr:hypothetical protein [Polynucleobacter sp.]